MNRYFFPTVLMAAIAFFQPLLAFASDGSLETYGFATVDAKPDVAFVTLYVQGIGLLMEDAYRSADEKATAISKAIREKHPEISSIERTTVDLKQRESDRWSPDREPETPQPAAIVRVRVTLPPDPHLAIAILDTGMRSGGSLVDPISQRWVGRPTGAVIYGLKDSQPYLDSALEKAFADAHERARRTAAAAGMALGGLTGIGCEGKTCDWSSGSYFTTARDLPTEFLSSDSTVVQVSASVCATFELLPSP